MNAAARQSRGESRRRRSGYASDMAASVASSRPGREGVILRNGVLGGLRCTRKSQGYGRLEKLLGVNRGGGKAKLPSWRPCGTGSPLTELPKNKPNR